MKSKSPFAMKSPLLAYKSDMRGAYANPKYVKEEIVGVKIGEALTKAGTDIFSGLTTKPKSESGDGGGSGGDVINNIHVNGTAEPNTDTDLNRRTEVLEEKGSGGFSGQSAKDLLGRNLTTEESAWRDDEIKRLGGVQQYRDHYKIGKEKDKFHNRITNEYERGKKISSTKENLLLNPISMKGSPVKHNAETALADAKQNNPFARMLKSNNVQQKLDAAKSQPRNFAGVIAQAISDQGGSAAGSIGQQIGNQAQQRAADAGGSTGVDPFLPPPNQVAETGSYGGGGDRILEMDSNPVGNQSIGRNTDITSQLFGSGQRASMLAMKGTPLYDKGHGAKQAHTHPSKTTTKMKPDGEYPGARYVKGDLVDQDDLLDKTKLDAHIATQVQSDKKGTFIKEMPDSGPGSDIETSKGFGKKIRLESMGRSSYTSNMKDQLDPHDFLFKNTPKNNKKK